MIRIVYIDDEANSGAMASKFEVMQEYDLEVIAVTEVEQAIPTLRATANIRAVVVDRIMPPRQKYSLQETNGGMSTGLRLLRDIRQEFPTVPILIVSVMKDSDAKTISPELHIAKYISKPVDGEELAREILDVLGERVA